MSGRPPKSVNSWCKRPTLTPTPTVTPTPPQIVYISLCTATAADGSGNLIVYGYADSVPNSYGNNPVNIDTNLTIDFRVSGDTTPYQDPIITITIGNNNGNIVVTDFAPNENILSLQILNLTPSYSSTQVYVDGGTTIGTCGIPPTPTQTQTQTSTPTQTSTQTNTPPPPTPTSTSTPTSTPICCYQYEITNYYTITKTIYYTDCNGDPQQVNAVGNGFQTYIDCAIEGSITFFGVLCDNSSTDCISVQQANTPCGGCIPPTPTLTATSTLTPTPSVTPTLTPTPPPPTNSPTPPPTPSTTPSCCYQYEITNYYTTSKIVFYVDCDGTPQQITAVGNGLQTYIDCAREGSLTTAATICDNSSSDCVTWNAANTPCGGCIPPTPDATPTPTQTPDENPPT
jgi:hypothetical protein